MVEHEGNSVKKFSSILITGASSGIGEALAENLAGPGIFLALCARNDERLQGVAERCRAQGAQVIDQVIDVTDQSAIKAWIEDIDEAHPLDLLIANAGVSPGTSGEADTASQSRRMMETNVGGGFNTVEPIITKMVARQSGTIGLVSSLAGFRGLPSAPGYGASKAWVRSYGEGLRGRLYPDDISVSVICPGFVASRITDQNNFKMPMFMTAPRAARIILKGLANGKARIAFPMPMYALVWILTFLPLWLTDGILRRLPKK